MTAYQSVGGIKDDTTGAHMEVGSARSVYSYTPLNPDVDCTRFVKILPSEGDDATIRCQLVEIPFADRPQYEALSYTWGGTEKTQKVEIDGSYLGIGQNLYDALCVLRKRQSGCMYWIDALCINQDDVAERNRQLGMMAQIYFRASWVIVWLGAKYAKYQDELPEGEAKTPDDSVTSDENTSPNTQQDCETSNANSAEHTEQREMVNELCADGYWKRVWIIQEIGQARRLTVYFGNFEKSWDDFVHLIMMHEKDDAGPMRLHRLRQEKDDDGYALTKLLSDHQDAKCQDPKDKVYGLVGLAGDAHGFPMDYNKSLYRVWSDTMEFVNRRRLVKGKKFIPFGRLVKRLLMGDDCSPWGQIDGLNADDGEETETELIDDSVKENSCKVFTMTGSAFGSISYLGPSTSEIVADLSKAKDWGMSMQALYRDDLGSARRESRMLIRTILDADDGQLSNFCHNHVSSVVWSDGLHNAMLLYAERNLPRHNNGDPGISADSDSSSARLYQACNGSGGDGQWKMGVVSARAQKGDILCSVDGVSKAVAVRAYRTANLQYPRFRIYGTARVSELMNEESECGRHPAWHPGLDTTLKMDARTLFVLLA